MIVLADVGCGYSPTAPVLDGVSFRAAPGELVAVVGPNGAGKTTLARVIGGLIRPTRGSVRVDGKDPATTPRRDLARTLAYLPQRYELAFPFTALEIVLFGRYAHHRGPGLEGPADVKVALAAMARCDVEALADRRFDTLSGGERRRILVAQALCQGAARLLLDEPTAGLDPAHAIAVMSALAGERERGAAVVVVTHDLDLAARLADRVVVLAGGKVVVDAPPAAAFASPAVTAAFGCALHVGDLPGGGRYLVAR
ncbi:MAG TPA: ABC transporter ATP-binding protein [Kofleriaceae bacterium]|nr:ABC transporter ATP-binding protein [Kofleriaceae bacterium]